MWLWGENGNVEMLLFTEQYSLSLSGLWGHLTTSSYEGDQNISLGQLLLFADIPRGCPGLPPPHGSPWTCFWVCHWFIKAKEVHFPPVCPLFLASPSTFGSLFLLLKQDVKNPVRKGQTDSHPPPKFLSPPHKVSVLFSLIVLLSVSTSLVSPKCNSKQSRKSVLF